VVQRPDAWRFILLSHAGATPVRLRAWRRGGTARPATRRLLVVGVAMLIARGSDAVAESDWLSLGNKQWAPTITSKSGIGTAHAVAEAHVTRKEIEGWCANWSPDDKGCVARELASDAAKQT
jgi:hypothetical protein